MIFLQDEGTHQTSLDNDIDDAKCAMGPSDIQTSSPFVPRKQDLHHLRSTFLLRYFRLVHKFDDHLFDYFFDSCSEVLPRVSRFPNVGDHWSNNKVHSALNNQKSLQVACRAVQDFILRIISIIQTMCSCKQDLWPDKFAQTHTLYYLGMLLLLGSTRHLFKISNRIEYLNRENADTARHQKRCTSIFKLAPMVFLQNLFVQS